MNQQDNEQRHFIAGFLGVPVASAGRLPMWTIPMCCVWAATRDIEAVAHVELNDPDSEVWMFEDDSLPFWHGAHVLAWQSRLLLEAGDEPLPDLGVALFQLQEHAARGTIVVRGLLRDEGQAAAIPSDAWANLQIMTWRTVAGFVAGPPDLRPSMHWWSCLRVLPDELLKVWPRSEWAGATRVIDARMPDANPESPNATDKDVKAYLAGEQARRLGASEQCGKNEVRVYLLDQFPHLSRDDADRFYDDLDSGLKPKSGPKGPWKNKRQSL